MLVYDILLDTLKIIFTELFPENEIQHQQMESQAGLVAKHSDTFIIPKSKSNDCAIYSFLLVTNH